jgi:hypothetical protein
MYVLNVSKDIKIMPVVEYIGFASLIFFKYLQHLRITKAK